MAEADDLHRLLPVEMARAFGEVNVQVLIGVVIIHVDGNVKIHAVDLIDQRDEALEIDRDIEINRYAEQVFDLLHQQLRAALGVGEVGRLTRSMRLFGTSKRTRMFVSLPPLSSSSPETRML